MVWPYPHTPPLLHLPGWPPAQKRLAKEAKEQEKLQKLITKVGARGAGERAGGRHMT